MSRILRHRTIDVSAPETHWRALGYEVTTSDVVNYFFDRGSGVNLDELLLIGIAETGSQGEDVLIWAMKEKQRRAEERTRVTAQAREAEAITALAKSIRESSTQDVLERILGRLTERTQYAVRQQLGQHPL